MRIYDYLMRGEGKVEKEPLAVSYPQGVERKETRDESRKDPKVKYIAYKFHIVSAKLQTLNTHRTKTRG